MILCPRCAVRNLPYASVCAFCQAVLQTPEQAGLKLAEWTELEPPLRAHLEKTHQESLKTRQRWLETLREKRALHSGLGALLLGIPMSVLYLCWWQGPLGKFLVLCLFTFLAGGWSGFHLNARGGGPWRGAIIFGGTYWVAFGLSLGLGLLVLDTGGDYVHFTVRAFALGSLAALFLGMAFGRFLEFDRRQDY